MPLFVSDGDAGMMLNGSIIERLGRLVQVQQVVARKATVYDLEVGEEFVCPADLEQLIPPKNGRLGYVNVQGRAYYVNRVPIRTTSIGLSSKNLRYGGNYREVGVKFPLHGARIAGLCNTYYDKFPTFAEALAKVNESEDNHSVAYDRSWSIQKRAGGALGVMFKGSKVGTVHDEREEKIKFDSGAYKDLMKVRMRPALQWR